MGLGSEWDAYMRLVEERPELFRQADELRIVLDEAAVEEFQSKSGRTIGVAYASPYRMMLVDLVEDPSGRRYAYERVAGARRTGPAVVSVAVRDGSFLLVDQFRHPLRGRQLGFVRGIGEPGLTAEENARKELSEELGADVLSVGRLGSIVADSGLDGTVAETVLCEVGSYSAHIGHEGIVGAMEIPGDELRRMVAAGEITDCFTLSALALLDARRG